MNRILIFIILALIILPLIISRNTEFIGSDSQAESVIESLDTSYKPWFCNIWTPPSNEIENLLFTLQAVAGASILFFIIGYYKGKNDFRKGKGLK